MVIDATWFGRTHFLIVYWDTKLHYVQYWRYTTFKEKAEEISQDLIWLKRNGVVLSGVTSDGSPGIIRAVATVYPDIPQQRCLVHIQRQVLAWLSQNPSTLAGALILGLNQIKNYQEKDRFVHRFLNWRQRNEVFLRERSLVGVKSKQWRYAHRNLRRCRALH
ncbi:MAG: hypothetical protein UR93_C0013G0005 [Berkelbacteria bacterium GW2011_GWA2_35_9]|uniref:Mutator family transposase n=1 Tax=Berkelbacteria bacterium GW2011_GWA2_35_9 TaxID=1618333 RepID=A0A0G0FM12_9BACT|nr:MAG: hypothetical protein UR93_C0013G0005 [Berkelbacteria bacterium GW2011_GWA2_35_9]